MARRGKGGSSIELNITSVPIFFVVLYGIMLFYYIRRSIRNPSQVFISLSLFCAIRVTAFVMFAVDSGDANSFSVNQEVAITEGVFLGVGFFALLYPAYVLVLERELASGKVVRNFISRVTSNRYLICFTLAAAVAIGIATFVCGYQGNTSASPLQATYAIIFLAITVLMGVQMVFQVHAERTAFKKTMLTATRSGATYIPCLILILLLIHEIFFIFSVTLYIDNMALWWTLFALPEILAVFLFAIPDLVPEKKALAPRVRGQGFDPDPTK